MSLLYFLFVLICAMSSSVLIYVFLGPIAYSPAIAMTLDANGLDSMQLGLKGEQLALRYEEANGFAGKS